MILSCLILTPFYVFSGVIIKACGQNPIVSEHAGNFIMLLVPGTLMQGFINIDEIILNCIEKANYSMYCLFLIPPIHLLFCWLLALHFKLGPIGIAISYFIANTTVFIIQYIVLRKTKEANEIVKVRFWDKRTL